MVFSARWMVAPLPCLPLRVASLEAAEDERRLATKAFQALRGPNRGASFSRSEYFDAHLHMHYLLRMEQSGVQDYLVNELYKMTDDDVATRT